MLNCIRLNQYAEFLIYVENEGNLVDYFKRFHTINEKIRRIVKISVGHKLFLTSPSLALFAINSPEKSSRYSYLPNCTIDENLIQEKLKFKIGLKRILWRFCMLIFLLSC